MFSVGFGTEKRENEIRKIAQNDKTTAVILASVHFEWMIKRTILKLGATPTKTLRIELANIYTLDDPDTKLGYKQIWHREIKTKFKKNAALGSVLGKLNDIKNHAMKIRGKIIHGNGTVSDPRADQAIDLFLNSGKKLREFAEKKGVDLDTRLKSRPIPKGS